MLHRTNDRLISLMDGTDGTWSNDLYFHFRQRRSTVSSDTFARANTLRDVRFTALGTVHPTRKQAIESSERNVLMYAPIP